MIVTSTTRSNALIAAEEENNPFFAWDNLADGATLGGTATLAGGDAFNATNGTTADFWLPNVTGTEAIFQVDFGTDTAITFAAIASHNLATLGASAIIESSPDAATWSTAGASTTPTDNQAIAWRFQTVSERYFRLRVTGLTAADPLAVGVAFFGNETVIPTRIYSGFAPPITANIVDLASNVSVGGNLMGSSIVSRGSKREMAFQYVAPAFIRATLKPFIAAFNEGQGFFTAWRPAKYPEDISYAWRDGSVIEPNNAGPRDLMALSVAMRVHNGG